LQWVPEDVRGDIRIPDGESAFRDIYGAERHERIGATRRSTNASLMEHRRRIQDMQQRLMRQQ
jgi:hypothetical protein